MDFSLDYTEKQEAFASEVRKWLDENLPKDLIPIRDVCKMSDEQWLKRREFTKKLNKDCLDLYGWEAGLSIDQRPPLDTYKSDDPQDFIK